MNKAIQKTNIENLIFFDFECVKGQEELKPGTQEYKIFSYKNRNKVTGEELPQHELIQLYDSVGALNMALNKIVCATVAVVSEGTIYVRSFTGTQEEIIKEFCNTVSQGHTPIGYNIHEFDLPLLRLKAFQEGLHLLIPDHLSDSGKKIWNLNGSIDLMALTKGTYYYGISLEEACYLAGIPSPKDGINGSDVSNIYYSEGVQKVAKYCEKDVISCIHLFQRMQGVELTTDIIYRDGSETTVEQEIPLLKRLLNTSDFNDTVKGEIIKLVTEKETSEKELELMKEIVLAHYQSKEDRVADKKAKAQEVEEFFNSLKG